jgi:hypothetical protein
MLINNDGDNVQWASVTDRGGEFVFERIPAGRYLAFVDAPGILKPEGFKQHQGPVIAQLKLNETRDRFTEVVVNGAGSVNVRVQAARGGVMTGRVVTEDDQPIVDADIKLLKNENGKWLPVDYTWRASGDRKGLNTDAGGVYRLAGLPSGDYLVRVSEAVIPADTSRRGDDPYYDGSLMVTFYPSANTIDDAQAVSVIEGSEATGIDIRVPERRPHTISGRVVGPDNQPGAHAEIWIERTDEIGFASELPLASGLSDAEGNWRVDGIPAGQYLLTLGGSIRIETADGTRYLTVAPKRIRVKVANEDVVVPDTQLTMGGWVTGKVMLDGKPPKRPFELFPRLIATDDRLAQRRSAAEPTSLLRGRYTAAGDLVREDGSFSVSALPAGKYWFEMPTTPRTKFYVKAVTRKGVDLMQSPIKLMDDTMFDDVVVTLATDFASIDGQVTRPGASAKQSLRDVVVVLAPANDLTRRVAGRLLTSQTDAQGKFSFACPPGEYFLAALTPAQLKTNAPLTDDYFKNDNQEFPRVKVRAAEKLKGLTVSLAGN